MAIRWWWTALAAAGFVTGRLSTGPDRHWTARTGEDWRALGPEAQFAYADGFLAGAGFAQAQLAADSGGAGADSAGLETTMAALHRTGQFRFPYAANVYVTRINDYYWWVDHRPQPTWYAFWEVNTSLTRPTNDPAR